METLTEFATIADVPVLTTGVFQGHKGPQVEVDASLLDRIIEGSTRLNGIVRDALTTGEFRGNPTAAQRINKPIPAPITLNHQVLSDDKIKDALKGVSVSFKKGLYNGKEWILQTFDNVPELAADIIRRFFTQASVELLNLTDPESGEEYPTIISTAFLDRATPPAVGGQPGQILVEFAAENEPCCIILHEPLPQRSSIMDPNTQSNENPVDVAELRKMQATLTELQAKVDKAEEERAKAIELARAQEDAKNAEIAELRAKANALDAEKLVSKLERIRHFGEQVFQTSPAYSELAAKLIQNGGLIELADGQNQQQGMFALLDEIAEMAGKNAILLPIATQGEKSYKRESDQPKSASDIATEKAVELMEQNPALSQEEADKEAFIFALNQKYGRAV